MTVRKIIKTYEELTISDLHPEIQKLINTIALNTLCTVSVDIEINEFEWYTFYLHIPNVEAAEHFDNISEEIEYALIDCEHLNDDWIFKLEKLYEYE